MKNEEKQANKQNTDTHHKFLLKGKKQRILRFKAKVRCSGICGGGKKENKPKNIFACCLEYFFFRFSFFFIFYS